VIAAMRRRLRENGDDAGIGLVEMMVASAIGILVLVMVGSMFIQTGKITTTAVQNRNSNAVASNAMQEISNVVRFATQVQKSDGTLIPAVVSGTTNTLTLYSAVNVTNAVNPAPTRVTFDATSGSLVETRCVATSSNGYWTFTTCASSSTRKLGGTFIGASSVATPLFAYPDPTSTTSPPASLANSAGTLPSTALSSVLSVTVSVNVNANAKGSPTLIAANVAMPNVISSAGS
jgi:Tfp pilus assembly protein PilW